MAAPESTGKPDQKSETQELAELFGDVLDQKLKPLDDRLKTLENRTTIRQDADGKSFRWGGGIIDPDVLAKSRPYSIARAVRASLIGSWEGAKQEQEVHQALLKAGYLSEGNTFCVPLDSRWLAASHPAECGGLPFIMGSQRTTKALGEGTDAAGGFLVEPVAIPELIDLLRAQTFADKVGVQTIPLPPSGQARFPKLTGAGTANWVGEAATITAADQTFGQLALNAKKLVADVILSRELLEDSAPAAESVIRADLAKILALKEDLTWLRGAGTATEPRGVLNTTGIISDGAAANGANGGALTYADLSRFVRQIEESNAPGPFWWVWAPINSQNVRSILDTQNRPIFFQPFTGVNLLPTVLGIPFVTTSQIPKNLTKGTGTNLTELYLADWSQAVIGRKAVIEILVSREARFTTDEVIIRAVARSDFGLRQPGAFLYANGIA